MRAFLAGPEKAPAKMNRAGVISFEDHSEYVIFIEKKLFIHLTHNNIDYAILITYDI